MSRWFRSNQAIGLYIAVIMAGLIAYIWMSPWAHREMRDGFLLGFFPLLGAGFVLFWALVTMADPLRNEVEADMETFSFVDILYVLFMLIGIGVYFRVMREVGFVLTTPVFLFVYMFWFGLRPVRTALILAVAIPVVTYLIFSGLGVRLPNGILPSLI